ncbi:hypothetical protein FACS189483_09850 [Spirochaetia bacterium]|nr:hypothetical protein FACS189483_09850 [Spirochaetia bacterium]
MEGCTIKGFAIPRSRFFALVGMAFVVCGLVSCIGISSGLTIRRDGSGRIELEYRISRELESLGKLEGNEGWPTIPVGRTDFERAAARIPGLTLHSYSSKISGDDMITQASLDFTNTDALLHWLDANGQRAELAREGGQNRLYLLIAEGRENSDSAATTNLDATTNLVAESFETYAWEMRFNLGNSTELTVADENRRDIGAIPPGWTLTGGSRALFSAPMGDLLLQDQTLWLVVRWNP